MYDPKNCCQEAKKSPNLFQVYQRLGKTRKKLGAPSKVSTIPGLVLGLAMFALFSISLQGSAEASGLLEIHFLSIGQGDSILIRSPSGKTALVDAGPPSAARIIKRYLRKLNIKKVNMFLVSHPHLDHYGGWRGVFRNFQVGVYVDPAFPYPSPMYQKMLRFIKRRKIKSFTARINQILDLGGGVKLRVTAPSRPFLKRTRSDANSNSIVMRLEYKKLRVLLTGDAEMPTEYRLMRQPQWLPSQLLKVAHHGSHHSSSKKFLSYVRPKIAVVSCGKNNRYGHPHRDALSRLRRAGVKTYVTARHGHVVARSNGTRLWVSTRGRSKGQADHSIDLSELPRTYGEALSKTSARQAAAAHGGALYHNHNHGPPLGQQPERPRWFKHRPRGKQVIPPTPYPSRRGYVAARKSKHFHRRSCRQAKNIPKKKRVYYRTRRRAIRSGRRPASDCLP